MRSRDEKAGPKLQYAGYETGRDKALEDSTHIDEFGPCDPKPKATAGYAGPNSAQRPWSLPSLVESAVATAVGGSIAQIWDRPSV